jgi:hypothetical protein
VPAEGAARPREVRDPEPRAARQLSLAEFHRGAAKLDPVAFVSRHPLPRPIVEHVAVDADRDVRTQLAGVLAATS